MFLASSSYLSEKKNKAYDEIGFVIYNNSNLNELDNVSSDNPGGSGNTNNNNNNNNGQNGNGSSSNSGSNKSSSGNGYIGTLEIEKIKLKKGFVKPSSKYNNIKYNVTIIQGYDFPDVKKGNFILAAHSGTGPLALFKDLYKLKVGDTAKVTYKNKQYVYKIKKIYYQPKVGYVAIYRDVNKTTLTLITCTKNNKKSQTVYIAELI